MSKAEEKFIEELNKEHKIILGFQEYEKKIANLEAKLAESESKRKSLEEKVKFLTEETEENFVDGQKYNELKQQLAEKDKEIEKLTEELDYKNFWNDFVDLYTGNKLKTQMLHENCKDKISFAVKQLEKVKRTFIDVAWKDVDFAIEIIDNQIKQLKEGK